MIFFFFLSQASNAIYFMLDATSHCIDLYILSVSNIFLSCPGLRPNIYLQIFIVCVKNSTKTHPLLLQKLLINQVILLFRGISSSFFFNKCNESGLRTFYLESYKVAQSRPLFIQDHRFILYGPHICLLEPTLVLLKPP